MSWAIESWIETLSSSQALNLFVPVSPEQLPRPRRRACYKITLPINDENYTVFWNLDTLYIWIEVWRSPSMRARYWLSTQVRAQWPTTIQKKACLQTRVLTRMTPQGTWLPIGLPHEVRVVGQRKIRPLMLIFREKYDKRSDDAFKQDIFASKDKLAFF